MSEQKVGEEIYTESDFTVTYGITFYRSATKPNEEPVEVRVWNDGKDITEDITQDTMNFAYERAKSWLERDKEIEEQTRYEINYNL
jgi:hypothetical protein